MDIQSAYDAYYALLRAPSDARQRFASIYDCVTYECTGCALCSTDAIRSRLDGASQGRKLTRAMSVRADWSDMTAEIATVGSKPIRVKMNTFGYADELCLMLAALSHGIVLPYAECGAHSTLFMHLSGTSACSPDTRHGKSVAKWLRARNIDTSCPVWITGVISGCSEQRAVAEFRKEKSTRGARAEKIRDEMMTCTAEIKELAARLQRLKYELAICEGVKICKEAEADGD